MTHQSPTRAAEHQTALLFAEAGDHLRPLLICAQLYVRNVSSSNRLAAAAEDEEAQDATPPPARLDGDIIRFDRCAPQR